MTAFFRSLPQHPTAVAVTLLICVLAPIGITAALMWSAADRFAALSAIPIAIVNDDDPVTAGDDDSTSTIAAGRQLVADLTDPQHPRLYDMDWILTDSADARDGLDSGRYHAVLTIPDSFSSALTSTAGDTPQQAQITIETNPATSALAGIISEQVAAATADELGDQASSNYLTGVYAGFNTISEQFTAAAGGAADLTSGAVGLAASSATVDTGADALAQNLAAVQRGADDLAAGSTGVSTGASTLADGSSRTAEAAQSTARATAGVSEAVGGAAQATGRLDGSAAALADAAVALADQCPETAGPRFCAQVRELAVRARAQHAATTELGRGLEAVAGAAAETSAASGQVAAATADISTGAAALAQNSAAVSAGAGDLAAGAQAAAQGSDDLAAGTEQLLAGANSVATGAQTLTTQLESGAGAVPTYTEADQETLARVVTNPITVTPSRTSGNDYQAWPVALIAATVLWLGAVATPYLRRRLTRSDVATAPESPARSALSTVTSVIAASVVQSIAVWITIACFGLPLSAAAATAGLTLLAGLTFTLLTLALTTLTPRYGLLLALTAFAAQLACATGALPIQTAPAFVQTLNTLLPVTVYSNAFTDLAAGGANHLAGAVTVLLTWSIVGFLLTMLLQSHRIARRHVVTGGRSHRSLPVDLRSAVRAAG